MKVIIFLLCFIWSQDSIGEGLIGEDLIQFLKDNYKTSYTLGYNNARDTLYLRVDNYSGYVSGIYSQFSVELPSGIDPSTYLYENGINCEHVWPQSLYMGSDPMKSDMHHLRPCKDNVNSYRGNKPFGEINDFETDNWFWQNQILSNIPSNNIDEYSENSAMFFEPRENIKGDIARTIFYFYTMYTSVADANFFEIQKDQLKIWHDNDPPDDQEIQRTWDIAFYQENKPNPYIIDSSLIERAFFYQNNIDGDVNGDQQLNVLDVVSTVSHILDQILLSSNFLDNADINNDNSIDILDIVIMVSIILS